MSEINSVVLIGRLTRDAEIRYTPNGCAVASFSLAFNKSYKKGDEWVKKTQFVDVKLFGKAAESLKEYLLKGRLVCCIAELSQDKWTDGDNKTHSKIYLAAEKIKFLGGNQNNGQQQGSAENSGNGQNYMNMSKKEFFQQSAQEECQPDLMPEDYAMEVF